MRNRHTITRWLAGLCLLLLASSAFAQSTAQLDGNRLTHDTYVRGAGQAAVTVSGTFTGTLTFKVKHQGQDPVAVDCFSPASPSTAVNVTTAPGSWSCPVGSYTWFEVQFSAYTSGTATIVTDTATSGGTTVGGAGGGGSFDGVLVDAAGGDPVTDAANDAIRVNIVAGSSSGTEYTEGAVDATISGGALLVEGAGNTLVPVQGTVADGVLVNLGGNNDVTVSGTVTANAGTGPWPVTDNGGSLTVDGSISCTNCSGSGASAVDDAAFTVATDSVAPAGFLFDDVTPDSVNEGDAGLARMSANRNQYTTLRDAAGNERGVNVTAGNALTVDGSASTQPVSNSGLTELAAAINSNLVDVNIVSGAGSGGTAVTDRATFTSGTTSYTPSGGFYQSTVTQVSDGQAAAFGMTIGRALKVALSNADGTLATYASDQTVGAATGTTGPMVLGAVTTSAPTYTTGQVHPLSVQTDGSLRVAIGSPLAAGTNNIGDVDVLTLPSLPTGSNTIGALTANQSVNVSQINGVTPLMGAGNTGTGSQRVTIASDQATIPVSLASVPSHAVTNAGTFATQATQAGTWNVTNVSGTVSLPTGASTSANQTTQITALQLIDNPVGPVAAGAAATNSYLAGGVYTATAPTLTNTQQVASQVDVTGAARVVLGATAYASAGATPFNVTSAASTNSTNVKASAGNVYSVTLINTTATLYYIRFYNLASAPTCSSATGYVYTLPVPASATGAGLTVSMDVGQAFTTGIGYCLTGGPTSTDNTNAAVGIYGFVTYK